ncbi:MAG: hypothetical protein KF791_00870 [Verrucomicrobiae bacterium]|nr:hypothetical protein [Verrucomicrobiae bacterium]
MRRLPSLAALLPSMAAAMAAEPTRTALDVEAAAGVAQSPGPGAAVEDWEFSASVLTYIVPDGETYPQPTVTADRDHLHLEARYNYEALRTGSLWIGANLSAGERVAFEFTPMVGGVFGDLYGIAMGYESSLSWWRLELYSEGEYVVDARNSSGNFLYNWTELSIPLVEWLRIGGVAQRTRAYDADRDIQRGVLVGVRHRRVSLTTYLFNPDHSDPLIVVAVGMAF